jgi:uncharacterized repeat protein (TIGR03803 family)
MLQQKICKLYVLAPFQSASNTRSSRLWKDIALAIAFCIGLSNFCAAQTFRALASFDGTNGESPLDAPLVQGANGHFYGTTSSGGADNGGTVFEVAAGHGLVTLYNFCSQDVCTDGFSPQAGVVLSTNGNFYGTTFGDEFNFFGTVFEITPGGRLATLHTFCSQGDCSDGADPYSGLVQSTNGNFYGTTLYGGNGFGTVFEITADGRLITVHSFVRSDGSEPGGLVQGASGKFYGITRTGGTHSYGTVFIMTPDGELATLYNFANDSYGAYPNSGLIQAADGNFYGTTSGGVNGQGTVFEITAGGRLATLYSFCAQTNCPDGAGPNGGLVQATDGNFYGTTSAGGLNGRGTIFEITAGRKLTTLYSFCARRNCPDGSDPFAALLQGTDGDFYGTTASGGRDTCSQGCGTVFSLSTGLGAFVKTLPASGNVGAAVKVLGTGLSGATSVSFNDTTATFTVVSDSEITTAVPSGASTGTVVVQTPTGILNSNLAFRVLP